MNWMRDALRGDALVWTGERPAGGVLLSGDKSTKNAFEMRGRRGPPGWLSFGAHPALVRVNVTQVDH